jgi:hypothetical protein
MRLRIRIPAEQTEAGIGDPAAPGDQSLPPIPALPLHTQAGHMFTRLSVRK